MRKSFFIDENVSIAVELYKFPNAIKELEELCIRAGNDGVSVVAVEKESGQVVGASFNKIQVPRYFCIQIAALSFILILDQR